MAVQINLKPDYLGPPSQFSGSDKKKLPVEDWIQPAVWLHILIIQLKTYQFKPWETVHLSPIKALKSRFILFIQSNKKISGSPFNIKKKNNQAL
jgi:hypothetical protein